MSENALENEFEKINLEEGGPFKAGKEESKGEVKKMMAKQLDHTNAGSSLKVKDRRKNLIKPARLKFIGTCWTRKFRNSTSESASDDSQPALSEDFDTFAAESFLKMRISGREAPPPSPPEEKDEKSSPSSSQPNSCSAQAKLQQQLSSSEFDSTIEEMSEFLAYHLKMYPKDPFLVDSMYT